MNFSKIVDFLKGISIFLLLLVSSGIAGGIEQGLI